MNLTQRQCKVEVMNEVIKILHQMNRYDTYEYRKEQRLVVIAELNHQAKRLQRKLPGMKETEDKA